MKCFLNYSSTGETPWRQTKKMGWREMTMAPLLKALSPALISQFSFHFINETAQIRLHSIINWVKMVKYYHTKLVQLIPPKQSPAVFMTCTKNGARCEWFWVEETWRLKPGEVLEDKSPREKHSSPNWVLTDPEVGHGIMRGNQYSVNLWPWGTEVDKGPIWSPERRKPNVTQQGSNC